MLGIARSLLMRPQVLLIDEPSMGLAPLLVREIFKVLKGILREHGVTVLLVEQDTAVALELASYAYVIEQGRITAHAPAEQLRGDPRLRAAYLGIAPTERPSSGGPKTDS
jgi:branched-chain amino acid transport system ATP-binding protein